MNRFQRRLALHLIDKKIKKKERRALKKMQKSTQRGFGNRVAVFVDTLHNDGRNEFISNGAFKDRSYLELRDLRKNVETIYNPWQGLFAPYWSISPKNSKYVEKFPPLPTMVFEENEFFDENWDGTDEGIDRWIESYEAAMQELEKENQ